MLAMSFSAPDPSETLATKFATTTALECGRLLSSAKGCLMRRRKFIKLIAGAATWPLAASAQEPGRTYRLGLLVPRDAPIDVAASDELRRRGFIEGQNLTVERRNYGLHPDRISEYAAELVKAGVDIIVAAGS